ncbi:MAG TPA: hypothetical protein VFT86_09510, partial [Gaiellaceae bacterium]|nr:hypothetical protein [Gaiellaceae bacterium]
DRRLTTRIRGDYGFSLRQRRGPSFHEDALTRRTVLALQTLRGRQGGRPDDRVLLDLLDARENQFGDVLARAAVGAGNLHRGRAGRATRAACAPL